MRPMLYGMNNPQGNQPLWPDPPGCTGHRILELINLVTPCEKRQYLRVFERYNVVEGPTYCARAAAGARGLFQSRMEGRTTVLLGLAVVQAVGFFRPPWGSWQRLPLCRRIRDEQTDLERDEPVDGRWTVIPHPSGLNRWYNQEANRRFAGELLAELYLDGRRALGLPVTPDAGGAT